MGNMQWSLGCSYLLVNDALWSFKSILKGASAGINSLHSHFNFFCLNQPTAERDWHQRVFVSASLHLVSQSKLRSQFTLNCSPLYRTPKTLAMSGLISPASIFSSESEIERTSLLLYRVTATEKEERMEWGENGRMNSAPVARTYTTLTERRSELSRWQCYVYTTPGWTGEREKEERENEVVAAVSFRAGSFLWLTSSFPFLSVQFQNVLPLSIQLWR